MSALKRVKPDERFAEVSLVSEDNKRRTALEIRCSKCPAKSHLISSGNSHLPTEKSASKFEARGWLVAKNTTSPDRDLCPTCKYIVPEPAPVKPAKLVEPDVQPPEPEKVVQLMPQQPQPQLTIVEEPKREASLTQRRAILDKLDECYDVPSLAYRGDWSDAKIAEKLNVPRKWIESIREQFFGPDENLATKQRYADLEALLPKIKQVEEKHLALASEAEQLYATVRKVLGK